MPEHDDALKKRGIVHGSNVATPHEDAYISLVDGSLVPNCPDVFGKAEMARANTITRHNYSLHLQSSSLQHFHRPLRSVKRKLYKHAT